jgi:hypothetical protein
MNSAVEDQENGRTRRLSEAAAFRARVEERPRNLESDLAEVKSRTGCSSSSQAQWWRRRC